MSQCGGRSGVAAPCSGFTRGNDHKKEPAAGEAGDSAVTLGSAAAGGPGALLGRREEASRGPQQGCPASTLQKMQPFPEVLSEAGNGGGLPGPPFAHHPISCRCRSGAQRSWEPVSQWVGVPGKCSLQRKEERGTGSRIQTGRGAAYVPRLPSGAQRRT